MKMHPVSRRRTSLAIPAAIACTIGLSYCIPPAAIAGRLQAAADRAAPQATAEIGKAAPLFTLKDVDGKEHSLVTYLAEGKTVVLEWFNPDCPFVQRHQKLKTMQTASSKYAGKDVVWVAINSGAPGMQGAGLERNVRARKEYGIKYPILLDESGDVGRAYGAKTSPHMFVIAKDGTLVYAGAIDDDPRGENSDRKNYVTSALDQHLSGKPVEIPQTRSYGCSVKYGTKAST